MQILKSKTISIFIILAITISTSNGQNSMQFAIAKKGDGILSLLRKQGVNPYKIYEEFIALNFHNLRDSMHLLEGRSYQIPTIASLDNERSENPVPPLKSVSYEIFGKKHAIVAPRSTKLGGAVYYLVSGHGGPDPGAMTTYEGVSISEDEYAYDVTLRLAKELIAHGAMVYVIVRDPDDGIRDDHILEMDRDEVIYPNEVIPLSQVARLEQRVAVVNKLYQENKGMYQRLIVTHIDSRSKGENIDVFFYHHKKSANGKKLAESIHKTFESNYKKYQPNRNYSGTFEDRTSLYLVRKTHPAMTFIEIGNITNPTDQRRILDPDNRQALAKWISEGVLLDYEK